MVKYKLLLSVLLNEESLLLGQAWCRTCQIQFTLYVSGPFYYISNKLSVDKRNKFKIAANIIINCQC